MITFSGEAHRPRRRRAPASAFTWNIDFLHDGHVHPGTSFTGTKSGSSRSRPPGMTSGQHALPNHADGHGLDGLTATKSVIVFPQKVNCLCDASPSGSTLYLDGIAQDDAVRATTPWSGSSTRSRPATRPGGNQLHVRVVVRRRRADTRSPRRAPLSRTPRRTRGQSPSGLVAAWAFNEGRGTTTADASGNGNSATSVNGPRGRPVGTGGREARRRKWLPAVPNSASLESRVERLTLSVWLNPRH